MKSSKSKNKQELYQLKSFYIAKEMVNKMKWQPIYRREYVEFVLSVNGLTLKIYTEFLQL